MHRFLLLQVEEHLRSHTIGTIVGMVEDPTGLNAGVYVLTVSDGAGCQTFASVTVNQPAEVSGTGEKHLRLWEVTDG